MIIVNVVLLNLDPDMELYVTVASTVRKQMLKICRGGDQLSNDSLHVRSNKKQETNRPNELRTQPTKKRRMHVTGKIIIHTRTVL